jgi:hypothetical protein
VTVAVAVAVVVMWAISCHFLANPKAPYPAQESWGLSSLEAHGVAFAQRAGVGCLAAKAFVDW